MRWLIPTLAAGVRDPTSEVGLLVLADEPGDLVLRVRAPAGCEARTARVALSKAPQRFGKIALYAARVVVDSLPSDASCEVELGTGAAGPLVDRCYVRTWPSHLGGRDAPFQVFLGSCYSVRTESRSGSDLAPVTAVLRGALGLPHVKLLCGDQVYLDIPVLQTLPRDEGALRELLAQKYLLNWAPSTEEPRASFGDLLRSGSNLNVSDDHEFWNNYPYFLVYGPKLWSGAFARRYTRAARELLSLFQLVPPTLRTFRVGEGACSLSLAVIDGRCLRSKEANTAHAPAELRRLAQFLAEAPGPAAVVLSQPLFEPSAGLFARTFMDRGLADLSDYGALTQAIAGCPHDVLVLSGDVHGGRVAQVRRTALAEGQRAQTILEVVSSPLSLVAGGEYLATFPKHGYPERALSDVPTYGRIGREFGPLRDNHGCRLSLWASDRGVQVAVEFLLNRRGSAPVGPSHPYLLR